MHLYKRHCCERYARDGVTLLPDRAGETRWCVTACGLTVDLDRSAAYQPEHVTCPDCAQKAPYYLPGRGMVAHAGTPYNGAGGPIGTCDDPFCGCHREHAASAHRAYLEASDAD